MYYYRLNIQVQTSLFKKYYIFYTALWQIAVMWFIIAAIIFAVIVGLLVIVVKKYKAKQKATVFTRPPPGRESKLLWRQYINNSHYHEPI